MIVIDRGNNVPEYSEQCTFCKHVTGKRRCAAFPADIPLDVWLDEVNHDHVLKGQQNNIAFERFEPIANA